MHTSLCSSPSTHCCVLPSKAGSPPSGKSPLNSPLPYASPIVFQAQLQSGDLPLEAGVTASTPASRLYPCWGRSQADLMTCFIQWVHCQSLDSLKSGALADSTNRCYPAAQRQGPWLGPLEGRQACPVLGMGQGTGGRKLGVCLFPSSP